ncbi:MAG: 23S rRNA (pseudouridine(1915)-N(3))-methyltransferase RlmH [Bacilli bacterium]|nr:23S rRNA (pseudouridine(1915)-N(3))-methyltransferase RlmH [Bacilli bacterium]
MNIRIICLGKVKEQSLLSLIDEYKKRISKYANFEIIELADESIPSNPSEKEILNIKKLEATKIKSKIQSSDFVVCLDQYGKQLSSEEFADKISDITVKGFSTIDFIIGGTAGLDPELITNCNLRLSFSKLTFPHQLIRLFLSEQIFRAFKILNNERYHW